jgi:hypothetical protein
LSINANLALVTNSLIKESKFEFNLVEIGNVAKFVCRYAFAFLHRSCCQPLFHKNILIFMKMYLSDELLRCCGLVAVEIERGRSKGKTVAAEDDGLSLSLQIS